MRCINLNHSEETFIPKVIHYCWFGGKEIPKENKKCIESWKKFLPDYEIKMWNENNYNINVNTYVKQAYEAKKYAFVSDYARFDILYKYGGIYMDTDVEVLKPIDDLLMNKMFVGFEENEGINPGLIFGAIKGMDLIKEILDSYKNRIFKNSDGTLNTTTVVEYTTDILEQHGLKLNGKYQKINDLTIYPSDFFCPLDYKTKKLKITENTYTIHHYSASWHSKSQKIKTRIRVIFGEKALIRLSHIKQRIKRWMECIR